MRFRAKNARYSTGLSQVCAAAVPHIGDPAVRADGGMDVRTDGQMTITSLSKRLGLVGYQICLAMVPPLARYGHGLCNN